MRLLCLKLNAAQEAIITPNCPFRYHSPPQLSEHEKPVACSSRLPSGARCSQARWHVEGCGGLRRGGGCCHSQQVPGSLLPRTNLRTVSTKNLRSTAGRDAAPACRQLAPHLSKSPDQRAHVLRFKHSHPVRPESTQLPACMRPESKVGQRQRREADRGAHAGGHGGANPAGSESTTNPSPHRHWQQEMTRKAYPHPWDHAQRRAGSPMVTSIRTLAGLLRAGACGPTV